MRMLTSKTDIYFAKFENKVKFRLNLIYRPCFVNLPLNKITLDNR
jgi:hypothetical protein